MVKRFSVCGVVLAILLSSGVFGQSLGGIAGEVKDGSGALIAQVVVTVTNTDTNAKRSMPSNESGMYSFPALVPGNYTVRVEMPGFRPSARSLQLQVQQTARVDFALELGQVTEQVEVSAVATLLNTEDATVGTVSRAIKACDRAIAPPWPCCSAAMPGYAPGVSTSAISGKRKRSAISITRIAFA